MLVLEPRVLACRNILPGLQLLLGSAQAHSVPWLPAGCLRASPPELPGLPSIDVLTYFPGEPLINPRCHRS